MSFPSVKPDRRLPSSLLLSPSFQEGMAAAAWERRQGQRGGGSGTGSGKGKESDNWGSGEKWGWVPVRSEPDLGTRG